MTQPPVMGAVWRGSGPLSHRRAARQRVADVREQLWEREAQAPNPIPNSALGGVRGRPRVTTWKHPKGHMPDAVGFLLPGVVVLTLSWDLFIIQMYPGIIYRKWLENTAGFSL